MHSPFAATGSLLPPEQDHYQRMLNFEIAQSRRLNLARQQRYLLNRRYFYGENEDADTVRQPLGIRYVPSVNQKHNHYLWGEWDKDLVDWSVTAWANPEDEIARGKAIAIQRTIYRLLRRTDFNRKGYLGGLDASVYGDAVFKTSYKPDIAGAGIDSILPEYYYAIWDTLDIGQTLECCVAYNTDRVTANSRFGTPGRQGYTARHTPLSSGLAIVWEYWNAYQFVQAVDDMIVHQGPNIYSQADPMNPSAVLPGHLPFVHIPNLGLNGEYFGFGDAEQVFKLADELNFRLADIGDVINYHAHPITLLESFYGDVEKLPVSADAIWDMGREGKASYLHWDGPQPAVMEFVSLLLRIIMETSSLTPIAFGQLQSSQASGSALNIQMLPVTEVVRRKRAIWQKNLINLAVKLLKLEEIILNLAQPGRFEDIYGFKTSELNEYEISVKWAPILPRDRLQQVNENVGLMANHARSIMEALTDLGHDDPATERDRILDDVREILRLEMQVQSELDDHTAKINKDLATFEANLNSSTGQDEMASPAKVAVSKLTNSTVSRSAATTRGGKNSDRGNGGSNTDEN